MYRLEDLDEPIRSMATNLESLENGKECFHLAVTKVVEQLDKIGEILRDLEKNLTGKTIEFNKLVRRTDIINELSIKFNDLLDVQESQLMNVITQPISQTLPS